MITGAQIVAARTLLSWEREKLAKKAKLAVTLIKRTELGAEPHV